MVILLATETGFSLAYWRFRPIMAICSASLKEPEARCFGLCSKSGGGIMAFPGLFFLPRVGLHYQYILFEMVAPGIAFGAIGAAFMTLLVRPGQKLRALVVGLLVGFGTPAAFFSGLAILLPKNERPWDTCCLA
jgi:hypothetical protein